MGKLSSWLAAIASLCRGAQIHILSQPPLQGTQFLSHGLNRFLKTITANYAILTILFGVSLGLIVTLQPAQAELFDSPVDRMPVEQRVALRRGEPLISGEQGSYVGKILVTATSELVWSVLTDYDNFPNFLPNVVASRVVKEEGNEKIVERIDSRQVFLVNVRSRTRTAVTESKPQRIDFRLVEGDLKKLQGYWTLEPISPYRGAPPQQVLLTQTVEISPAPGTPDGIFYGIFKDSLVRSLVAIREEAERRVP